MNTPTPSIRQAKARSAGRLAVAMLAVVAVADAATPDRQRDIPTLASPRSLDGSGNHPQSPDRGRAGTAFVRIAPAHYADDASAMAQGPSPRYISNRVFQDLGQNLFSENGATQWGAVWGQFIDHTIGLRDQSPAESAPLAFDPFDPLEKFQNDLGLIPFGRTAAAPGSGIDSPRQQLNIVSAYIDGWAVYGGTEARLEWLRPGPVDGDITNNSALLLTSATGYLPRADARPSVEAPEMELVGRLAAQPARRVIAGDVRANENIALTAVHTLFVREHNRIVGLLPDELAEERKFQIARRVIGALQQHITYEEFLPAMGLRLPRYRGYRPDADASIINEFAAVGFRAHSMVHGEIEVEADAAAFSASALDALASQGVAIALDDDHVELAVPLNVAFGNPDLVELIGLGPILAGLASERQYNNDEQIDDQLRSVLFQLPISDTAHSDCLDGELLDECFQIVLDLGALDIARARDHGIANYNDLREAYGLARVASFIEITGEDSSSFESAGGVDPDDPLNDPDILLFDYLEDSEGGAIEPGSEAAEGEAVVGIRRSTLAARLAAIYADVDAVGPFVGMVAEAHERGSELGPLQQRMWQRQFVALRDGDRYFYRRDAALREIGRRYGLSWRRSLAQVIAANTILHADELPANVFEIDSGLGASDSPRRLRGRH